MKAIDVDLLTIERGSVTAPAGCGKTQLIADALMRHSGSNPILVLTHTNAGVAALRGRLQGMGVVSRSYRLATIDGWAMRLIAAFPLRSGHDVELLELGNPRKDYQNIRLAAVNLLESGHVTGVLSASYSRLIVDEYQDCSIGQHRVVTYAAEALPTCVLGDPMQAIFGFGSNHLAEWDEVCRCFPLAGELSTPWRWINADAEPFGHWLLEQRRKLVMGKPVHLGSAPAAVEWIELDGSDDHKRRLEAARFRPRTRHGRVLIIGDSANLASQRKIASQTPGATTVEAVDLRDLVTFAKGFEVEGSDALEDLVKFAQSVMSRAGGAGLLRRVKSLRQGTARKPASEVEIAAIALVCGPTHGRAADLLGKIAEQRGVTAHRPAILRACVKALRLCEGAGQLSFSEAAIKMREQYRLLGRRLPQRAVGSTLLLKGLEAEGAVILNADAMDARNLYVAMTRGSEALRVCSRSPVLTPRP